MHSAANGDYIDLTENPERFTGYSGPPAHRVWASIYDENCFGVSESSLNRPISESNLLGLNSDEGYICEEKRIYYRIISGNFSNYLFIAPRFDQIPRSARIYFYAYMPRLL